MVATLDRFLLSYEYVSFIDLRGGRYSVVFARMIVLVTIHLFLPHFSLFLIV